NFARRALEQFKNLHELQAISIEGDKCQFENEFRYAAIKIATMIFKRMVYESRRKSKGILRPKVRQNYKEQLQTAWPRTHTEKLLSEMFDCRAAQFLAILEALNDLNRRLVLTSPAASDNDPEILDVTLELFYAADYILQVKHANVNQIDGANLNPVYPNITMSLSMSLLDLAINEQYVIPFPSVIQLIKNAFNYEVFDVFERLLEPLNTLIAISSPNEQKLPYQTILSLLELLHEITECEKEQKLAAKQLQLQATGKDDDKKGKKNENRTKSPKTKKTSKERSRSPTPATKKRKTKLKGKDVQPAQQQQIDAKRVVSMKDINLTAENEDGEEEKSLEDYLEDLCNLLLNEGNIQAVIEPDVLIDVSLLLWNKCRPILRRYYNEPLDSQRWISRLDHDHLKWLNLCLKTHEVLTRFDLATVDPCAYAECSLRLGQILFSLVQPDSPLQSNARNLCYKSRIDQLRVFLSQTFAQPFVQSYVQEFKRGQQQSASSQGDSASNHGTGVINTIGQEKQQHQPLLPFDNDTLSLSTNFPLLLFTEQLLERSLQTMAQARASLVKFDGSAMYDRNWQPKSNDEESDSLGETRFFATQPFQYEKGVSSKPIGNLIKDLDAELLFIYCRVISLLEQLPEARMIKKGPIEQYLNEAKGNSHKKALICAAYASTRRDEKMAADYMQRAYKYLTTAEEEDRLYFWHLLNNPSLLKNQNEITTTTIPRPHIIARAPEFVFILAPDFEELDTKVGSYRIFCRAVDRPNAKARMADTYYPGTGQQIPSSFKKPVKISGLNPDLKYVFSIGIYDVNGQLIGESVSESTEPILAAHPTSLLLIRCILSQVSYQIKQYPVAKKVFHSLWTYFVKTPQKIETTVKELVKDSPLVLYE
ncbi:unnamed protein product, partial [Didymodactylos carnosus]